MTDEEMAEEYASSYTNDRGYYYEGLKEGFLTGLKVGRPKWHDLRENPNDLPTGEVNPDIYPIFSKSEIKPRIKVVAKIFFKGYKNPTPWEDILYYEDGKWLKLHHTQGKCKFFKEIPKCEYVLEWCELPQE